MKLLGKYNSNLVPFHAQELLKLLEQAITLGEYGGSRLVDAAAVEKLKQQSRGFSSCHRFRPEAVRWPVHLCSFTLQKPILTKAPKRPAKCTLSPVLLVGSRANRIALGAHFSHPGALRRFAGLRSFRG